MKRNQTTYAKSFYMVLKVLHGWICLSFDIGAQGNSFKGSMCSLWCRQLLQKPQNSLNDLPIKYIITEDQNTIISVKWAPLSSQCR